MTRHYSLSEEAYERLNNDFFENYQHEYWFYKLKTLDYCIENLEEVKESIGGNEIIDYQTSAMRQSLKADVVLQFYHISEALFSLMVAVDDSAAPWLEMKYIGVRDIADFIRDVIQEDELGEDELKNWFYHRASEENEGYEEIRRSLEFIEEYLPWMGRMFLDNDVYNEYKHGLRLYSGYTQMRMVNDDERQTVAEGKSLLYLDQELVEKDGSEEFWQLSMAIKSYDYDLYLKTGLINYHLIRNLIVARQVDLDESGELEEPVRLWTFAEDVEDLFDTDDDLFTVKAPYPTGDLLLKIG